MDQKGSRGGRHGDVRIALPAGERRYLDRLFVLRHLVGTELDRCFAGAAPPAGKTVLVWNEVDAGLGDIAFVTKLMRLLRRAMPELGIVLVSTGPDKQRRFGLDEAITMYGADEYPRRATPAERRPDLVLSAPGIFDHCRKKALVCERLGLDDALPFLYVAEYGSLLQLRDDAFRPLMAALEGFVDTYLDEVAAAQGVAADEIGHHARTGAVVVPDERGFRTVDHLTRGLTASRADNPLYPWLTRALLDARSCGLELGEMGIHVDEELRAAANAPEAGRSLSRLEHLDQIADRPLRELLLGDRSIARYDRETALYAAYAYAGIELFIDYVAVLQEGASRDIDLVLPTARTPERTEQDFFTDELVGRLERAGVGEVEIVGNAEEDRPLGELAARRLSWTKGKRLRLITRFPLPYRDMRILLQAAERPTMVSGDQSFSDAVSAGKEILVVEPVYCQTYHLDAVLDLAERVSPDLREVLSFGMQVRRSASSYERIRGILRTPDLPARFARFDREIQSHHNANEALVSLVKRTLLTHARPDLRETQEAILREVWATFSPEEGIRLPGERLAALARAATG